MVREYSMRETDNVAKNASKLIEKYLYTLPYTVDVKNVESDPIYRKKDIDLLWVCKDRTGNFEAKIEIKCDRQHYTGNYFFETKSNEEKNTPGCFIYTEAHYIFYYFQDISELHILPMPEVKDWFLSRINEFKERKTTTPLGNGKFYTTVGRIVPRKRVIEELKILIHKIK